MKTKILPMFPLNLVLFPEGILPLHIFEERYRVMVEEVMKTDRCFGVILIERGYEVGGGDTRKTVGTLAEIVDSKKSIDGRWILITRGVRRIKAINWLDDSPYPRAEVEFLNDDLEDCDKINDWPEIVSRMRRMLAVLAELGDEVAPISIEISDDPILGSFQMASVIPVTSFDLQKLLESNSVVERCALIKRFLKNIEEEANSRLFE